MLMGGEWPHHHHSPRVLNLFALWSSCLVPPWANQAPTEGLETTLYRHHLLLVTHSLGLGLSWESEGGLVVNTCVVVVTDLGACSRCSLVV